MSLPILSAMQAYVISFGVNFLLLAFHIINAIVLISFLILSIVLVMVVSWSCRRLTLFLKPVRYKVIDLPYNTQHIRIEYICS